MEKEDPDQLQNNANSGVRTLSYWQDRYCDMTKDSTKLC
jgi:hypothetical protein